MPTNRPDPASVLAARKIQALCGWGERMTDDFAAIIESTTHVGELREALAANTKLLRMAIEGLGGPGNFAVGYSGKTAFENILAAESVLAKLPKEGK